MKTKEKCHVNINLYLNETELRMYRELKAVLGLKGSAIIRKVLFDDRRNITINARESLATLDKIGEKVGASTDAIYSLLEKLDLPNDATRDSDSALGEFNVVITNYVQTLSGLESAIRLLLRTMKN